MLAEPMLRVAFISRSGMASYLNAMLDFPRALVAALLMVPGLVGAALVGTAGADDDRDHDRARAALRAGEIRPLKQIVDVVQDRCRGKVIEVELDRRSREGHDFWLYELRMLMPKGDVLRLDVDAATVEILKIKGQGAKEACQ